MIDHVSIGVRDLARSRALYARLLAPLGYVELTSDAENVGFGKQYPEFWLSLRPTAGRDADPAMHVCLRARNEAIVRAFHAAAIENGCACDLAPTLYPVAGTVLFNTFIRDPDGNRIEVATYPRTT